MMIYEARVDDYDTSSHYDASTTVTTSPAEGTTNSTPLTLNSSWSDYDLCNPNSSSEDFLTSPLFQTCIYIMYCTVFVVALLGNGLVCFIVQTSPRMKTVTNYFIVNLAVGDILMTVFCVPFSFVSNLVLRFWPFGAVMCRIVNYSQAVSVLVSAYTLLAISIDRYMAIMRPLKPRLGKTAAKMVVAAVWAGALATAAPISIVSQLSRPTKWHQFCKLDICLEQWDEPEQSEQYTCALMTLQFALPLGALVCTYARIAHVVWGGRPPGEAHCARDSRMQRSKRKMVKMMVTVVVVFTVCWLPLNIFIVLWTVHEQDEEWSRWPGMPYVWFASHWLAMSHCCYNPIIYCYMNARYRRGFKQVSIDEEWSRWPGMPYVWFASHWLAMSHCCYNPIIYCYMNARYRRGFKQALNCVLRTRSDTPSRHRSSLGEGMPMSEMMAMNGMVRRGTSSSCISRMNRGTCSSCASVRRGGLACHMRTPAPPVRALSVRPNFN